MPELELQRHPSSACAWISSVTVRVDWLSDDLIVLYYRIAGDIDQLRLPAQQRSARADGLWRNTCFEAFIKAPDASAYFEFNFSPSSEWAVYRFDAYRQGMTAFEPSPEPKIICRRREGELDADIDVHLGGLNAPANGDLQVGLAAILEDQHGGLSYWALAHPEGNPDFHHAAGFALTLPRPAGVK